MEPNSMDTDYLVLVWEAEEQKWRDCGEGPFSTFLTAQSFAKAEVGVPWRIVAVVPIMQTI